MTVINVKTRRSRLSARAAIIGFFHEAFNPARQANETFTTAARHIAFECFSNNLESFEAKSSGTHDRFGEYWHPLTDRTVAMRLHANAEILKKIEAARRRQMYKRVMVTRRSTTTIKEQRAIARKASRALSENRAFGDRVQKFVRQLRRTKALRASMTLEQARKKANILAMQATGRGNPDILVDSGRLVRSLTPSRGMVSTGTTPPEMYFYASRYSVDMGTSVPYAKFHQQGTKRMVARPLVPSKGRWKIWAVDGMMKAALPMAKQLALYLSSKYEIRHEMKRQEYVPGLRTFTTKSTTRNPLMRAAYSMHQSGLRYKPVRNRTGKIGGSDVP